MFFEALKSILGFFFFFLGSPLESDCNVELRMCKGAISFVVCPVLRGLPFGRPCLLLSMRSQLFTF